MNLEKLNQWLLLLSHAGILAGLILVALQIRQDSDLARVQLFSDITSSRIDMAGVNLGENPAPIIAKSLTDPDALTLEERVVMDAVLIRALNEVRRNEVLRRVGLDVGVTSPENVLAFYFGNEFAKRWWAEFIRSGEEMDEVLMQLDALIRSTDSNFTLNALGETARSANAAGR